MPCYSFESDTPSGERRETILWPGDGDSCLRRIKPTAGADMCLILVLRHVGAAADHDDYQAFLAQQRHGLFCGDMADIGRLLPDPRYQLSRTQYAPSGSPAPDAAGAASTPRRRPQRPETRPSMTWPSGP